MSLSTTSTCLLKSFRDGDWTTCLGSLFKCLITFYMKKCFLISNLNLPWHHLRPFCLILSLVTWEKRLTPTSLQPPFKWLWKMIRYSTGCSPTPPGHFLSGSFPATLRITESLRLEKTSEIIKPSCQAITTMPTKPCTKVPHLCVFWTSPGMGTPPLPWAACSNVWPLF